MKAVMYQCLACSLEETHPGTQRAGSICVEDDQGRIFSLHHSTPRNETTAMPHTDPASSSSSSPSLSTHCNTKEDIPQSTPSRRGTIRESAIPFISSFSQVDLQPQSHRPNLKLDLSATRAEAFIDLPRVHPKGPRPQQDKSTIEGEVSPSSSTPTPTRTPRFTPVLERISLSGEGDNEEDGADSPFPVRQFVRRASTPFPRREESEWLTASDIENLQDTDHEGEGVKAG